jgi:hypothetical protein
MTNALTLFVSRPGDGEGMYVIECVTCSWFVSYMFNYGPEQKNPSGQRSALTSVQSHAVRAHKGRPRVLDGMRP